MVERRDTSYLQTFGAYRYERNPDVDETEMMLSESDSKYVRGWSNRKTFFIENSSKNHWKTTVLYNKYHFLISTFYFMQDKDPQIEKLVNKPQ